MVRVGPYTNFMVQSTTTIGDLKTMYEDEKDDPSAGQHYEFQGTVLEDDKTLLDYGIGDDDEIEVTI